MKRAIISLLFCLPATGSCFAEAARKAFDLDRVLSDFKAGRRSDSPRTDGYSYGLDAMGFLAVDALVREVHAKTPELSERIEAYSELHLGVPFQWGPLGEGALAAFDSQPTLSFKSVDCVTFVEQVMALALAENLDHAGDLLQKIRYKDGRILYRERNHFPSTDWIPNNVSAGYLRDITRDVGGDIVKVSSKTIRKSQWYRNKAAKNLEGPHVEGLSAEDKDRVVMVWRELGSDIADEAGKLPYIPIAKLPGVAGSIPSGSVVTIIRADKETIPVMVSHQGLLIRKQGKAYFRHAAFSDKVVDVPFLEYFYKYFNSKWPILGLNITFPARPALAGRSKI